MKSGSYWRLVPETSSLMEYLQPLMISHLSPVISSKTKTFPSQGEETVLGCGGGRALVIFLVKKALKVG